MERTLTENSTHRSSHGLPEQEVDRFSPELVAARLRAFEELQALLQKGSSTSGRNGRPWSEYLNEGRDL